MSELDEKLAKARRIKNPQRRAEAEARVLEEMSLEQGTGDFPIIHAGRKNRAGGGRMKKGS